MSDHMPSFKPTNIQMQLVGHSWGRLWGLGTARSEVKDLRFCCLEFGICGLPKPRSNATKPHKVKCNV